MKRVENKFTVKQHHYIYAFMYGFREDNPDHIIKLTADELLFPEDNDSMVYIWGGPGPDYNRYYFKDYGKTWAYEKEELC